MPALDDAEIWVDVLLRVVEDTKKEGQDEGLPWFGKIEHLLRTAKTVIATKKEEIEKEEINGERCTALGPAASLDTVKNLVDTILTVSTLLTGFTATTFYSFGHSDLLEIEERWGGWCSNTTSPACTYVRRVRSSLLAPTRDALCSS